MPEPRPVTVTAHPLGGAGAGGDDTQRSDAAGADAGGDSNPDANPVAANAAARTPKPSRKKTGSALARVATCLDKLVLTAWDVCVFAHPAEHHRWLGLDAAYHAKHSLPRHSARVIST